MSSNNSEDKYELVCNSVDEEHQDKRDSVLVSYKKSDIPHESIFGSDNLKVTIAFKILFGIIAIYFIYFIFNILFNKVFSNLSRNSKFIRR